MFKFVFLTCRSLFGLSCSIVALLVPVISGATSIEPAHFDQLAAEGGLEFNMPVGFEEIPLKPKRLPINSVFKEMLIREILRLENSFQWRILNNGTNWR